MNSDSLNIINANNQKINNMIQQFISISSKTLFITDNEGNCALSPTYKKIIELEINKTFQIYHLEFPNLPFDSARKITAQAYQSDHPDAHYENYTEFFNTGLENPEELFYRISHETSHAFGFPGNIFEGLTESISRQVALKYGLLTHFDARQDLVELFQKIEKVIGRDNLASHTINNNPEDLDKLANILDNTLDNNIFKNLYETFDESCNYLNTLEQSLLQKLNEGEMTHAEVRQVFQTDEKLRSLKNKKYDLLDEFNGSLDSYINTNPSKLYNIGETSFEGKPEDYERVISLQESEISTLEQILQNEKKLNFKNSLKFDATELPVQEIQTNNQNLSYEQEKSTR